MPVTTLTKPMDIVDLDHRAAAGLEAIIAGTSSDQWTAPTPCPEWTVRDLVAHVVSGNVKYTGIARGDDWRPGGPDIDLGGDPVVTYRRTVDAMLDAWREPGALEREIELPRGRRGRSEVALWIHLAETLVHGWDLAKATGQEPVFDPDAVEASLADCQSRVPPQRAEGSPFRDPTSVGEDATPLERLVAYLGRDISA
jgi:uncharacterized protein (TIGR03086 family)